MKIINTSIKDVIILEPVIHKDKRGSFSETFNSNILNKLFGQINFLQDNESISYKGVVRGLHFQIPPFTQSKLIRCLEGRILDVVVDLRKTSKTYSKTEKNILSDKNNHILFVPKGFAHGFIVLSDYARVSYKVDNNYNPDYERGIIWNDKQLNIDWGIDENDVIISNKDFKLPSFSKISNPF
tara:strand:+ start:1631 stop:2179 length:549 start_codon:yes stop_codon:yes gene_type:complete